MKVVIVGGGFCGVFIAKYLEKTKNIETTLIDSKSYYEYQPSLHKVLFKPSLIEKLRKEYTAFLHKTDIIVDTIREITPQHVKTNKGTIKYDVLVIATGIEYPIFLDNKKNVYVLKNGKQACEIAEKIQNAYHILIVGGGVIGTEITGEIITKAPQKKLTFIHPRNHILERLPSDASDYSIDFFKKNNVKLIFGEKIASHKEQTYITTKNREIKADLCIWCTGIKTNPAFMKKFSDSCFTDRKALKVDDYLQLEGYPNIFVGGDISNVKEEKNARKAELHAKIIAKNIKRLLKQKPLIKYKSGRSPMVISLGDWRGLIIYKYVFPGLIAPGILKYLIQWWVFRHLR